MNIGLFFGSFNPIHIGHLIIANYMIEFTEIEEVWFVVSPQNPFKIHDKLADEKHRLAMAKLAVEDHDFLKVSEIEFGLSKPSFTLNTLNHLHKDNPEHEFKIIMGADNLAQFHKWKGYEEILNRHELFVYHREGFDNPQLKLHPKVRVFDAPVLNISATFIREVLQAGKSIRYLVPARVEAYIKAEKLY